MEKQEFYNHKKPRKLLDQVRDVMRLMPQLLNITNNLLYSNL